MKKILVFSIMAFSIFVFGVENVYNYADLRADKDQIIMLRNQGFDLIRESLRKVDGSYSFKVYATDKQFEELRILGFDPQILVDKRTIEDKSAGYHSNKSIGLEFDSLQTLYPTLCKRIQVGTSVLRSPIWALKISDNVTEDEPEPEFKYTSTMHGEEPVCMELCMELIYDIVDGYIAGNDTMRYMVDNTELYIMPLHNPDGWAVGSRYNANGVELNSSFPERIYNDINTPVGKEPETAAMINWNDDRNFVMSANLHSAFNVVNYPWDIDDGLHTGDYAACPDDANFVYISRGYADRNPSMTMLDNGITNGCEWWELTHGMQDWNYHYYGDMEVMIEISENAWPDYSEISLIWTDNRSSMLWYIMAVHKGIKGTVTDSSTGEPLEAKITIDGIQKDYFSNAPFGDYYKILKPGTYSLRASLIGYNSKYFTDIVVKDSLATVSNIELDSIKVGMEDKVHLPEKVILEQNYPNPFNPNTSIGFSIDEEQFVKLRIYNINGKLVQTLVERDLKPGCYNYSFKPTDISGGIYFYNLLTETGASITKKMILMK